MAVQQWSKLPSDLLSAIYLRLDAPSDRACFDAVCTSWRATASHPQRRVLPWLILDPCGGDDGRKQYVYCLKDRTVQPGLPFLHEAAGKCFVGGGQDGGWITSTEAPSRIINIFSGAEVELAGEHIIDGLRQTGGALVLRKIIFSEKPTSSGCILAGITDKHDFAFYTVGFPESGWTIRDDGLMDIPFCKGELYGITRRARGLIRYEFSVDGHGAPVLLNIHWLSILNNYWENPDEHARYIVELGGKLLTVGSNHNWASRCLRNACGPLFTVHKLVDTGIEMETRYPMRYKWVEVKNLGEHTLFLGPTCSKALRVPAIGCGDMRRNQIYFSHHRCLQQKYEIPMGAKVLLTTTSDHDDCPYYKEDESDNGGVEGIMSVGYYVMGGDRPPMWLFPPDI